MLTNIGPVKLSCMNVISRGCNLNGRQMIGQFLLDEFGKFFLLCDIFFNLIQRSFKFFHMQLYRLILEITISVRILQGIVLPFLFIDIPAGGETELL